MNTFKRAYTENTNLNAFMLLSNAVTLLNAMRSQSIANFHKLQFA